MWNKYKEINNIQNGEAASKGLQICDLLQLSRKEREARYAAQEAIMAYRFLRRERAHAFQHYIDALPARGVLFTAAAR